MQGKYIYGIIDSSDDVALGIAGLGGAEAVSTVAYRGVGCVLSDYCGEEFSSMPSQRLVPSLLRHQVVIEHIMRQHTVLPVKFGTVLAGTDEVYGLLAQGHLQFTDALAKLGDKTEAEVAATWNLEQVLREVSNEKDVVHAREAITGSPLPPTFEQRIHLGKIVKTALDRHRDSYRQQMISYLKPVAVDMQAKALVSDQLVMNVAFLVAKTEQREFDSRVQQLNDLFNDQVAFRVLSPLPAYSFATVDVARLEPERVEEARRLLHLDQTMSESEVRRAYRRLAAETHPDSKPGDELAKVEFARLRQASELLIACCRGQAQGKGSLVISIRRHRADEPEHLRFAEAEVVAGAVDG